MMRAEKKMTLQRGNYKTRVLSEPFKIQHREDSQTKVSRVHVVTRQHSRSVTHSTLTWFKPCSLKNDLLQHIAKTRDFQIGNAVDGDHPQRSQNSTPIAGQLFRAGVHDERCSTKERHDAHVRPKRETV